MNKHIYHTAAFARHNIAISCDRAFTVAAWFSQIMQTTPRAARRSVLLGLLHAVLQFRLRGLSTQAEYVPQLANSFGGIIAGSIFYLVTDTPALRDFRVCKKVLTLNHQPVLVVPAYALNRARQMRQRSTTYRRVPIFTLETSLATGLLLEAIRRGCTMPEMWETIISEYNHNADLGLRLKIMLEWSSKA